jgi:hypothetical protein
MLCTSRACPLIYYSLYNLCFSQVQSHVLLRRGTSPSLAVKARLKKKMSSFLAPPSVNEQPQPTGRL